MLVNVIAPLEGMGLLEAACHWGRVWRILISVCSPSAFVIVVEDMISQLPAPGTGLHPSQHCGFSLWNHKAKTKPCPLCKLPWLWHFITATEK
jgi:hypothetical protein